MSQGAGGSKEGPSLRAFRGSGPRCLGFGFPAPEPQEQISIFKPPSVTSFVTSAQETDKVPEPVSVTASPGVQPSSAPPGFPADWPHVLRELVLTPVHHPTLSWFCPALHGRCPGPDPVGSGGVSHSSGGPCQRVCPCPAHSPQGHGPWWEDTQVPIQKAGDLVISRMTTMAGPSQAVLTHPWQDSPPHRSWNT